MERPTGDAAAGDLFPVQAQETRVEAVGPGQALAMLTQAAEQSSSHALHRLPADQARQARLEHFERLRNLAGEIPVFLLYLDRVQPFWQTMEAVLDG